MKKSVLILTAVWLAGCASAPASKPAITEGEAAQLASLWYGADICGAKGMIDVATAALGKTYAREITGRYRNPERVDEYLRKYAAGSKASIADTESCNRVAINIAEIKRQRSETGSQPSPGVGGSAQTNRPTFTNCSTYFGQTFCTTY